MYYSEQDQINQLESKVNSLLRRLEEVEIELNELKNLNAIISGIETEIPEIKDSIAKIEGRVEEFDNQIYRIESAMP